MANHWRPFVWLASYPKSGNTWFRALLTSYLQGGSSPSIHDLVGWRDSIERELFNEYLGLDSSELVAEDLLWLRPAFHRLLARYFGERERDPVFLKVHDAFLSVPERPGASQGEAGPGWLYAGEVTKAAICLVRNPLDVAVSYAHQRSCTVADTIGWMDNPDATEGYSLRGLHCQLPEPMGRWSDHVLGWLRQREFPLHVVRYEDMSADAEAAFGEAIEFLERHCPALADQPARADTIAAAVAHATFDRLQAQEAAAGFPEKNPNAKSFFRAGTVGGWRDVLTVDQVAEVVAAHGPAMERLGYLAEAEEFLRDAGR